MGVLLTEKYKDVVVAYFQESSILDDRNIQALADELFDIVDRHTKIDLLLNFEAVEYLSSAVLGKLIALHKKVATEKGRLKLCAIKANILEVFKVTRLDKVLEIHPTQEAAMAAFSKKGFFR